MNKEVIYTLPYQTASDIKVAGEIREELYEHYNSVQVCPNGLYEVRIVCTDEIIKEINI
jgi:hypothetical protein